MELQSEQLEKLIPSLVLARGQMSAAVKAKKGNWGMYASLEDIILAINGPLLDNEIFVSQASSVIDNQYYIVTQATHVSGQWMRAYTKILNPKQEDPQKMLAGQTYARRAGMEALFNVPRVDDDGEYGNVKPVAKAKEKTAMDKVLERVRSHYPGASKEDRASRLAALNAELKQINGEPVANPDQVTQEQWEEIARGIK